MAKNDERKIEEEEVPEESLGIEEEEEIPLEDDVEEVFPESFDARIIRLEAKINGLVDALYAFHDRRANSSDMLVKLREIKAKL